MALGPSQNQAKLSQACPGQAAQSWAQGQDKPDRAKLGQGKAEPTQAGLIRYFQKNEGWLSGWLACWLPGLRAGWLAGLLAGCWLAGWLAAGWLAGRYRPCHRIPLIKFVPQKTNNKVRATANHMNRLISGISRLINGINRLINGC